MAIAVIMAIIAIATAHGLQRIHGWRWQRYSRLAPPALAGLGMVARTLATGLAPRPTVRPPLWGFLLVTTPYPTVLPSCCFYAPTELLRLDGSPGRGGGIVGRGVSPVNDDRL